MNRILKLQGAGEISRVQSLSSAWGVAKRAAAQAAAPLPVDPELLELREEQAYLRRLLEQQSADIEDLRKQADEAFHKGEAQGRDAGRREAEDQGAKSLVLLESGIERALVTLVDALSGLERLAPLLARQALASVFGESDHRAELVGAIVHQQMKAVEARGILHIEVSATDFSDEAALTALADSLGSYDTKVYAYSALKSGDCRIKLRLGTLEVGLDQQWGRLQSMLEKLSELDGGAA